MPRQSPKYRQVSESGPSGAGGASYPAGDTGQPPATPWDASAGPAETDCSAAPATSLRATSLVRGRDADVS